jgi:hypothetical protein
MVSEVVILTSECLVSAPFFTLFLPSRNAHEMLILLGGVRGYACTR